MYVFWLLRRFFDTLRRRMLFVLFSRYSNQGLLMSLLSVILKDSIAQSDGILTQIIFHQFNKSHAGRFYLVFIKCALVSPGQEKEAIFFISIKSKKKAGINKLSRPILILQELYGLITLKPLYCLQTNRRSFLNCHQFYICLHSQ